jgi:uncharacterized integral membrane protein
MENSEPAYRYAEGSEPLTGAKLRHAGIHNLVFAFACLLVSVAYTARILTHYLHNRENMPLAWVFAGTFLLIAVLCFWAGIERLRRYSSERHTLTDQQDHKR